MKKTPVIPSIVLHHKLAAFINEKKIKFESNNQVITPQTAKPVGLLAKKIDILLEERDQTFKSIAHALSIMLNIRIPYRTLHSWYEGRKPRLNEASINKALDKLINKLPASKTWVMRSEVKKITKEAVDKFGLKKTSIATGVPIATLGAWSSGLHRVKTTRFNSFIENIHTKLLN